MKKLNLTVFAAAVVVFTALACGTAFAGGKIDTAKAGDGLVKYEYTGDLKDTEIHVSLELSGGTRITPRMYVSPSVLPLNTGTGEYQFKILEKLPNGKAKPIAEASAVLEKIPDDMVIYIASNMNVDFAASKVCIPEYKKLTDGLEKADGIAALYEEVVNNYTYDHDKAKAVVDKTITYYLPDIDAIYEAKKGICFDYSAVLAGALRSQGVPVKLCKGYAEGLGEYHAWNEIYVGGKWVVVDTTVDAAYAEHDMEYIFEKDSDKYKATSYF